MTPKQESKQIFETMTQVLFDADCRINKQGVKAATLVVVRRCLLEAKSDRVTLGRGQKSDLEYWKEVLEETEKM